MNPYDFKNYEYIMSLSEEQYDEFLNEASDEDLNYLQELIDQRKEELNLSILEYEDKLATLDVSLAASVLRKFML